MSTKLVYQGKEKKVRKSTVIDQELERIYKKKGVVTPEAVLAEAAKATSPIHGYFEWDDVKAGQKYRMVQAYSMILASKFIVSLVQQNGEPKQIGSGQVRKLVSAFRGEGFRLRNDALAQAESRQAIIESKKSQLRSWCNSTIDIVELGELRESILAKL